jgi:hypothetical protein
VSSTIGDPASDAGTTTLTPFEILDVADAIRTVADSGFTGPVSTEHRAALRHLLRLDLDTYYERLLVYRLIGSPTLPLGLGDAMALHDLLGRLPDTSEADDEAWLARREAAKASQDAVSTAVAVAGERARSWDAIAAFLAAHPEIAREYSSSSSDSDLGYRMLCCVNRLDDPGAFMSAAARACVDAGGRVEQYASDRFGGVKLWFGVAHVDVYAEVGKVFSRRVVGVVEKVEYAPTFDLPGNAEAAEAETADAR